MQTNYLILRQNTTYHTRERKLSGGLCTGFKHFEPHIWYFCLFTCAENGNSRFLENMVRFRNSKSCSNWLLQYWVKFIPSILVSSLLCRSICKFTGKALTFVSENGLQLYDKFPFQLLRISKPTWYFQESSFLSCLCSPSSSADNRFPINENDCLLFDIL